jgi:hypothetical protein
MKKIDFRGFSILLSHFNWNEQQGSNDGTMMRGVAAS